MDTLSAAKNHNTNELESIPGYSLQTCIGHGTFAKVYVGTDIRTQTKVAIKKIILNSIRTLDRVRAETDIIKTFDHPNIVKCIELVQMSNTEYMELTKTNPNIFARHSKAVKPAGYIVMEYCNVGTFEDVLEYHKKNYPVGKILPPPRVNPEQNIKMREANTYYYMKQLRDALIYIQERGYMHRDIKPMNVLLHSPNLVTNTTVSTDDNLFGSFEMEENVDPKQKKDYVYKSGYIAKLADFGLSKYYNKDANDSNESGKTSPMLNTVCGSPLYMAPELLMNSGYTDTIDLWSYGIIMYEMLFGYRPTESTSIPQLKKKILLNDIDFHLNYGYTKEATDLLQKLLTKDRVNRITWSEFANHPWFSCWFYDPENSLIYRNNVDISSNHSRSSSSSSVPNPLKSDTLGVFLKQTHISNPLELQTSNDIGSKRFALNSVEDKQEFTNMSNLSIVKRVQQHDDDVIEKYIRHTPRRLRNSHSKLINPQIEGSTNVRNVTKPIAIPSVSHRSNSSNNYYDNLHHHYSSSGTPKTSPNKWSDPFASPHL